MNPGFWLGIAAMAGVLLGWRWSSARARRLEAEAMALGPGGTLPSVIQEGFHRHDRSPEPALWPGETPAEEQHVKVHINLHRPMVCANRRGERTNWFAMGGQVKRVLAPDRVEVALVATTDVSPRAFAGHWVGTLELKDGLSFPWVLTRLAPEAQRSGDVPAA